MNILQFISDLVGSLAWPVVVIILVVLLRKEINELLATLTRLKIKDVEMDFQRLTKSAGKLPPSLPSPDLTATDRAIYESLEDQILKVSESAPSAAILLAWASVEIAMSSAVARMAISPEPPEYRSAVHNLEQLQRFAGLPQEVVNTISEMRTLRNKVAHDERLCLRISQDSALSYTQTAIRIINYLNGFVRLPPLG